LFGGKLENFRFLDFLDHLITLRGYEVAGGMLFDLLSQGGISNGFFENLTVILNYYKIT
jgi:hypothetical protein